MNAEGMVGPKHSLWDRFWRWAGFLYHLNELPDGLAAEYPGWMLTDVNVQFDLADRLRLLISGNLHLQLRQATTQQVDHAVSATSFHILPPGEQP